MTVAAPAHSTGSTANTPELVFAELAALGYPRTPRAYEVWFAYRTQQSVELAAAVDTRLANGPLNAQDFEELHELHFRDGISVRQAERSSKAVSMEIDAIVDLVRMAMGSANRYNDSLSSLLSDLVSTNDPLKLKGVVEALVSATNEAQVSNEGLEKRLRTARSEIDELRGILEATRLETLTDPLTGISNRKHFDMSMRFMIEQAHATRKPFSLLMIDIDHFKQFNDTHGHLTGDKVLRVVAQTLRSKFPNRATVARFGGEEFAVLLPESDLMAGWIGAEAARQTILGRELVKRSTGEKIGRITVSIGIGTLRRNDTAYSLVSRADRALIAAKSSGRNQSITEDQLQEPTTPISRTAAA